MLLVILRQERLQIRPGMYPTVQVAQVVLPPPVKDDLMCEGPLFPGTQRDQKAVVARRAYCFRGQSMPEFGRWQGRSRPNGYVHGNGIAFEGPQRRHGALYAQGRARLYQSAVDQRQGQGQYNIEPADGAQQQTD
jgi:hypothetical protein